LAVNCGGSPRETALLKRADQSMAAHVTLKIVEGAGHGFGGRDMDEQVRTFFEKHLRTSAGP
jgi:hypothetical protein